MEARLRRLVHAVILSTVVALMPTASRAQSEPERAEAQQRFDEGNKLYAAGKYDEARVKFVQAWATLKRPSVLFNLARSEQLSGKSTESAKHWRAYLRMTDPKITDRDREEARGRLRELDVQLGRLTISAPVDARVSIDGDEIEAAALAEPVSVTPGVHTLQATWGGKTKKIDVQSIAGQATAVAITDEEAHPPPAAAATTSAGVSGPPADVTSPPPAGGEHGSSPWPYVGWVALGAGVIAGGVGVVFGVSSFSDADRRDELRADPAFASCPNASVQLCADVKDASESRAANANRAYVFGGAGIVLAGAGAAILLLRVGTKDRTSASIIPLISPTAAGIATTAHF